MANTENRSTVTNIARGVVEQLAPEELTLFPSIAEAYFSEPQKVLKSDVDRDDMLGFGVADGVTLLSPIALLVASQAVEVISGEVRDAVEEQGTDLVHKAVKQLVSRIGLVLPKRDKDKHPEPEVAAARAVGTVGSSALTSEQLARIRQLAFEEGLRLRLTRARAELFADAIVGRLVTYAP